nr:Chain 1, TnrA peptide [synthetic construct]4S0R_2 Chain 2, TnrA peptide [synthetic construct]4S0R_O Chain O, TnrA peptide [synthetic construct]4S0R_P Chain P, TnrA peptide [synthetic construct]4S0R_Q Chain Q, TnrA peptide [synthetic construct]4S0R_R Chain R, TnrA peptide [synthetic construct]4S0R_S Chain S, TnrA peptide [synthetic construct]4S0R_T Chain T, TnrA peptide [synthetic construct]4S0R_U Chain U, TnrA peptide [synthetic construct]4S0R_V Chain V, TnrA peptide [synthetic construc
KMLEGQNAHFRYKNR